MAANKTIPTKSGAIAFLKEIKDRKIWDDCIAILEMMRKVSKSDPVMWGSAIVGFGTYHYVYESGREGDMVILGFSPRKQNIAIYLLGGLDNYDSELSNLGKYTRGKGCLYIKSLGDVNSGVLNRIFSKCVNDAQRKIAGSG